MTNLLRHNDADLDRLLDKLERETPALTPRDIEVLTTALRALATDQLAILRLERLLAIHGESASRLDAILADARVAIARAPSGDALPFDIASHAAARNALARRVDDARTGRDVILAALAFARDIAPAFLAP
jgi:hypothetical protein